MGVSVIAPDLGDRAPAPRRKPGAPRLWAITVAIVVIIVVALLGHGIVQPLGSDWHAEQVDQVRSFLQAVSVLWPR